MKLKIMYIAGVIFILSIISLLWYMSPHLWTTVNSATVFYNDQALDTSQVYKSSTGIFLVSIKNVPNEDAIYLIYPSENKVGMPSNSNQFLFLANYAYNKDIPLPVVFMNDKVKSETDPKLIIDSNYMEFTSSRGGKVKVILKNN